MNTLLVKIKRPVFIYPPNGLVFAQFVFWISGVRRNEGHYFYQHVQNQRAFLAQGWECYLAQLKTSLSCCNANTHRLYAGYTHEPTPTPTTEPTIHHMHHITLMFYVLANITGRPYYRVCKYAECKCA